MALRKIFEKKEKSGIPGMKNKLPEAFHYGYSLKITSKK